MGQRRLLVRVGQRAWSGAAGSGWISAALAGSLAAGVNYKVAICNGAASPAIWSAAVANYYTTGFGSGGLTAGPISVPNNASALSPGQESYNLGATPAYPSTNAGPFAYGLDLEVTLVTGSGLLMACGII